MEEFDFTIIALSNIITFKLSTDDYNEAFDAMLKEFIFIFSKIDHDKKMIRIEPLHKNSDEIQDGVNKFINKHRVNIPQFGVVKSYFNKLKDSEYFYFLFNSNIDLESSFKLYNNLKALSEGKNYEDVHNPIEKLFKDVIKNYKLYSFGDKRISIGESDATKRICRFCNNKTKKLTFRSKAHAISEALGNKTVVLFDECDVCNNRFSMTIEPHIVQYLSFFRTFYEVKGKGGTKDFKGQNFHMTKEDSVKIMFDSIDNRPDYPAMPYSLKLKGKDLVNFQNIYKCFCKYFISVVDKEQLSFFQKTIAWINGEIEISKLPKIAETISYHTFTTQPRLVVYIRKNDNNEIPYAVGEFYFTCLVFVFIIPFSTKDDKSFCLSRDYNKFWYLFHHYDKAKSWAFNDYSSNSDRKFILNLNFGIKKDKSRDSSNGS